MAATTATVTAIAVAVNIIHLPHVVAYKIAVGDTAACSDTFTTEICIYDVHVRVKIMHGH